MKMFPLEVNYKQIKGFLALVSSREGVWSLLGFIPLVHDLALISHHQSIINSGVSDFVIKPRLVHKYPAVSSPAFLRLRGFISLVYHCVRHASDSVFSFSTHVLYGLIIPSFGHHFENSSCLMPISGFILHLSGSGETGLGRVLGLELCSPVMGDGVLKPMWADVSLKCSRKWRPPIRVGWDSLKSTSINGGRGWFLPEKHCGFLIIRVLFNSVCDAAL